MLPLTAISRDPVETLQFCGVMDMLPTMLPVPLLFVLSVNVNDPLILPPFLQFELKLSVGIAARRAAEIDPLFGDRLRLAIACATSSKIDIATVCASWAVNFLLVGSVELSLHAA